MQFLKIFFQHRKNHSLTDVLKPKCRIHASLMPVPLKRGLAVGGFCYHSRNTIFKRTEYIRSLMLQNLNPRFSQGSVRERRIFSGEEKSAVLGERDRFLF